MSNFQEADDFDKAIAIPSASVCRIFTDWITVETRI